jgi:tetratricopeptide (TPR) repeat protein
MKSAYKPDLKFVPDNLDLYGGALIDGRKFEEAIQIYEKINNDYPLPASGDYRTASRDVQEAQAIHLAGLGKALLAKGDPDNKAMAAKLFAELEAKYPWSTKRYEAHYGIAVGLHDMGKDKDALQRLVEVAEAPKASTELRAKSLLLIGKIHHANKRYELAIENFIKASKVYAGVPEVAAEGLWLGGQLQAQQATGAIPMPTPAPKATAATPRG